MLIFALIALLVSNHQILYAQEKPLHLIQATQEFNISQNAITFEQRKAHLCDYYLSGAYDNDLQRICHDAIQYFKAIPVTETSLVVFDIDDTALFNVPLAHEARFIWPTVNLPALLPAIKPVFDVYTALVAAGFKIIFLSGRPTNRYAHTVEELHHAHYTTYEDVILTPARFVISQWKLAVRKQLSKIYTIVGCVGDRAVDFMGGYTGYEVRLPNYIY